MGTQMIARDPTLAIAAAPEADRRETGIIAGLHHTPGPLEEIMSVVGDPDSDPQLAAARHHRLPDGRATTRATDLHLPIDSVESATDPTHQNHANVNPNLARPTSLWTLLPN